KTLGEQRFVRGCQEQHGLEAGEAQRLERIGRTSEVVAVEGEQQSRRHQLRLPNFSIAAASSGRERAYSSIGVPDMAASQPCCMLRTPAAVPPGCAMMPPPARWITSMAPVAE